MYVLKNDIALFCFLVCC